MSDKARIKIQIIGNMKVCPVCGHTDSLDALYCASCSSEFPTAPKKKNDAEAETLPGQDGLKKPSAFWRKLPAKIGAAIFLTVFALLALGRLIGTGVNMYWQFTHERPVLVADLPAGWEVASDSYWDYAEEALENLDGVKPNIEYVYSSEAGEMLLIVAYTQCYLTSEECPPYTDDVGAVESWLNDRRQAFTDNWKKWMLADASGGLVLDLSVVKLSEGGAVIRVDDLCLGSGAVKRSALICWKNGTLFLALVQTKTGGIDLSRQMTGTEIVAQWLGGGRDKEILDFLVKNLTFK